MSVAHSLSPSRNLHPGAGLELMRYDWLMKTPKQEVCDLLDQLPEDVSTADIQYHLYVRQNVARGVHEVREGKTLSEEEVESRLSKWLGP
jgi:hypothetical protein